MLKGFLIGCGLVFIILCGLAATTLPFWAYYRLAHGPGGNHLGAPKQIVLLAGAGIPSENGLIRAWYTAALAEQFPEAGIIIAVPGKLSDLKSDPHRIAGELILRGVDSTRIAFAHAGKNTRGQALEISAMILSKNPEAPLALVSSPEHIRRAVLSFRKCGFTNVKGVPAFETSLSTSLIFNDKELKGNKIAPPIGENLQMRYQFWNHLKLEVIVLREYTALAYYKLRGWI